MSDIDKDFETVREWLEDGVRELEARAKTAEKMLEHITAGRDSRLRVQLKAARAAEKEYEVAHRQAERVVEAAREVLAFTGRDAERRLRQALADYDGEA